MSDQAEKVNNGNLAEDDDFENCKGRCGYTIWCRECMKARDEAIRAQEEAEFRKKQEMEAENNSG